MANRAYLLNTSILTSDPQALRLGLSHGNEYVEIADAAYRIPLPWLCCFRGAPLYKVSVPIEPKSVEDQPTPLIIELPCIDVATAQQNLRASLHIFQEVAGDAATGEGYWRHACDGLADLPLPYLTLNPIEVLFMSDPVEEALNLATCIRSTSPPISLLNALSKPWDGFVAFSAEDFYSRPMSELDHKARLQSSRALAAAYLDRDRRFWHRTTASVANVPSESETFSPPPAGLIVPVGQKKNVLLERRPWWRVW